MVNASRFGALHWYLLALLVLLLPVQFSTSLGLRFAPSDVCLALLVVLGGVRISTSKTDWSVWHLLLVVVFSAAVVGSSLRYGEVTRWALVNKYIGLLILLVLYVVIVQYARSFVGIQRLARLVLLSVVLQAVVALPLYFVGQVVAPLHVDRIQGLAADPNAYGGLIVMAIALHWATVNSSSRLIRRRLAWPVTVLLLANLLFCYSRSSWIGFVFVVLAILALRRRAWAHATVPILAGACIVLVFFRSYFVEEIWPLAARPEQVVGRVVNLEKALDAFLTHPIAGSGLGSFLQEHGVQVHNTFLWMLAEMGVIGAIVFVGFALVFVFRGYRSYRRVHGEHRGLVAGLLIGHVAMLGLSLGIEALYQRSWWVMMALLNSCWVLSAEARTQVSDPLSEADLSTPGTSSLTDL